MKELFSKIFFSKGRLFFDSHFWVFKEAASIVKKAPLTYNHQLSQKVKTNVDHTSLFFDTDSVSHAEFVQKQGEMKLLQGDLQGIQLFDVASKLEPNNAELLYSQGTALVEYGSAHKSKKYLLQANKKFKAATKISPDFFKAWRAWGLSLFSLGKKSGSHHFILEAKQKFEKAIVLSKNNLGEDIAGLYWDYGKIILAIGEHSGEVSDLNLALDAHAKASSFNEHLPIKFWQDFGVTALKLGIQINDIRLLLKAVNCQKNALSKSISNFDSWYYLADALSHLYNLTHDEDHFCQANDCFTSAAKLQPGGGPIWTSWATLLLKSGSRINDSKRLYSALEKCHRAHACNRKDKDALVPILVLWAETLAILGSMTEKVDLIHDANNKAVEAEEGFGESADISYAHGIVLYCYAQYYNDLDYYYQAVEKFQEGLSIDRTHHKLWFYLGHTYRIIAELENDPSLFERAGKFFSRAINLHSDSTYFYEYALSLLKWTEFSQDKTHLENAVLHFEQAFSLQKNAVYLHPEWLYHYAHALDLLGDFFDDDKFYMKSIEILKRVLILDPDFANVHYKLALVYSHIGELTDEVEIYVRALSHYKLAYQNHEENDQLILDWSLALINLAEVTSNEDDREQFFREAEYKLIQSAKLGNTETYYHLGCLYSLMKQYEKAMHCLEKAEKHEALPSIDEVMEDLWLENLRHTELFKSFINHLQA